MNPQELGAQPVHDMLLRRNAKVLALGQNFFIGQKTRQVLSFSGRLECRWGEAPSNISKRGIYFDDVHGETRLSEMWVDFYGALGICSSAIHVHDWPRGTSSEVVRLRTCELLSCFSI